MRFALLVLASVACFGQSARVHQSFWPFGRRKKANKNKEQPKAPPPVSDEEILNMITEIVENIKEDSKGESVMEHLKLASAAQEAMVNNPKVAAIDEEKKKQQKELNADPEYKQIHEVFVSEVQVLQEAVKKEKSKAKPNERVLKQQAQKMKELEQELQELPKVKLAADKINEKVKELQADEEFQVNQKALEDANKALMDDPFFKAQAKMLADKTQLFASLPNVEDQIVLAQRQIASLLMEEIKYMELDEASMQEPVAEQVD